MFNGRIEKQMPLLNIAYLLSAENYLPSTPFTLT
jgi:hypothetical protein